MKSMPLLFSSETVFKIQLMTMSLTLSHCALRGEFSSGLAYVSVTIPILFLADKAMVIDRFQGPKLSVTVSFLEMSINLG